jgi:hypothetical protein
MKQNETLLQRFILAIPNWHSQLLSDKNTFGLDKMDKPMGINTLRLNQPNILYEVKQMEVLYLYQFLTYTFYT